MCAKKATLATLHDPAIMLSPTQQRKHTTDLYVRVCVQMDESKVDKGKAIKYQPTSNSKARTVVTSEACHNVRVVEIAVHTSVVHTVGHAWGRG
jgi:hypothetical protein